MPPPPRASAAAPAGTGSAGRRGRRPGSVYPPPPPPPVPHGSARTGVVGVVSPRPRSRGAGEGGWRAAAPPPSPPGIPGGWEHAAPQTAIFRLKARPVLLGELAWGWGRWESGRTRGALARIACRRGPVAQGNTKVIYPAVHAELENWLGIVFSGDSAFVCVVWQRGVVTSERSSSQNITVFKANTGLCLGGRGRL